MGIFSAKMCDCVAVWVTYFCLHQEVSLATDVVREAWNVDAAFVLDLPHHAVDEDVGAGATHASTGGEHIAGLVHQLYTNNIELQILKIK